MIRQYVILETHIADVATEFLNTHGKQGYRLIKVTCNKNSNYMLYVMEKTEPEAAKEEDLEDIIL